MHTFLTTTNNSEYLMPKDHLLETSSWKSHQASTTRRQRCKTDPEMCMFALTVSTAEPKTIKEAMADSAWIKAMQEELHQFDRLQVWELVDKPFGKNVIKLKWLWKNKKDEDQTLLFKCRTNKPDVLILAKALLEEIVLRTEYQLADMFTKALPEDRFQYLVIRIVNFHHDGNFVPSPLMYLEGEKSTIRDLEFEGMTFIRLSKLLQGTCMFPVKGIFFLIPSKELSNGLIEIKNDLDLANCIAVGYKNRKVVDMFLEHHGNDLSHWIQTDIDNNDDELSDVEMEDITGYGASDFVGEDDVVIPDRSINDPFLNKLCNGNYINDFTDDKSDGGESSQPSAKELEIDSDDEDVDKNFKLVDGVIYPKFDPKLPWNKMKPTLGLRELGEGRSGGKKGKKGDWPYKKEKNKGELPKKDKGVLLRSPTKGINDSVAASFQLKSDSLPHAHALMCRCVVHVEILVPIPSESKGVPKVCDVPFHDNSPPLDISKDQSEDFSDSNVDSTSTDEDSFSKPSSGSPTTHSELSLPDYKAFYIDNDHFKEKSSGSTTTHVDFSQYDSFIFDLSNDQFPPADRSDFYHEEFADGLAHIISPPEYDRFCFKIEPELGNLTMDVVGNIFQESEPRVHVLNVLPTLELDFIPSSESIFAYVVWIFLPFLFIPVIPPYLLSCGDEDTIFDPGISKDCPDCEDSQFCHSSRVSHPQLHLGIRYPNLID
ncbi:hypothetical protein Tco_0534854 [Tanacetum coccineum]